MDSDGGKGRFCCGELLTVVSVVGATSCVGVTDGVVGVVISRSVGVGSGVVGVGSDGPFVSVAVAVSVAISSREKSLKAATSDSSSTTMQIGLLTSRVTFVSTRICGRGGQYIF